MKFKSRMITGALLALLAVMISACAPSARVTSEREVSVDGQTYKIVTVAQLKTLLESKDFLLVNVHIPYEGEIKGTDLFVPYNEIEQNLSRVPDKNARIVVYCRSGRMSEIAAKTLAGLGYTDIRDVQGGMEAWTSAGYQLIYAQK
ncbi:MAG TPA: rhodanese-like domain-containing protein [Dehalococcoidales bacterium]|nr:rhodanese-like domain-containing protein [Dehalococcoidales bacterium]